MSALTVVRARQVVTAAGPRPADLVLRRGLIESLAPYGSVSDPAADLHLIGDDLVVLPGLVDSHVHVNEPGRTEWEGFATATRAAAAGGITTIVDMPLNSIPPTIDVAALEVKRRSARDRISVDVAFWGGAVPGNTHELTPLHEAGVVGFKCFLLPSGVEEFAPLSTEGLTSAMTEIAGFDGLLIAHAEAEGELGRAHGRRFADFVASRPPRAETAAIEMLLEATRRTGCRTHVVHVSSAEAAERIAAAKAEGLPVTAETCPHYLLLDAADVPDGATQFKCCPPIRGAANRDALWRALLEGTLDLIVSDHSPCTAEAKRLDVGDFGLAWGGIASVQLSFAIVWTAAAEHAATLTDLARWMSTAPAALTGLTDRGAIEPGLRADLAVVDAGQTFVVDPTQLHHRNPVSPYTGRTLRGVVRETWLRGTLLRDDEPPRGQLISRASVPSAGLGR